MFTLTGLVTILSAVANALPAAEALGVNIADLVTNGRALIERSTGEATADELAAASAAVAALEAAFDARVAELGRVAPNT